MHIPRVFAQGLSIEDGYRVDDPAGFAYSGASVGEIVGDAISYVIAFAGIFLLLRIIISGFIIMISAGDAKKLAQGRSSLTSAVVGFILVFGAFWVVQIVGVMFGWEEHILGVFGQ